MANFGNEEEEEQSKTITFDNEEEQSEDKSVLTLVPDQSNNSSGIPQRRSRRESPRKHLTYNSRVKPVGEPVIGINWWPASPAFEPSLNSV